MPDFSLIEAWKSSSDQILHSLVCKPFKHFLFNKGLVILVQYLALHLNETKALEKKKLRGTGERERKGFPC